MAEDVAPEYIRFVAAQRQAAGAVRPPVAMAPGDVDEPVNIDPESAGRLLAVAAKRASGLFRPTRRAGADSAIAPAMLQDLALTDHHVAVRSLRIGT